MAEDFYRDIKKYKVQSRGIMRIKKVKVGIKDVKTSLHDFVRTCEAIDRGLKLKKETEDFLTSFMAF